METVKFKLSIITINLNNDTGLEKTILSVISQTWKNFEHIIIDGASTDKSVDIINAYQSKINCWVSEEDRGIFHAMNKGVTKAKGEYILMLNSGDVLTSPGILEEVFHQFPATDIVYTDVLWEDKGEISEYRPPERLSFQFFFTHHYLPHQSTFIRKALHDTVGLYDETQKLISDWKFMVLAICKHNVSYAHLSAFTSQCDRGGISLKPGSWAIVLAERKKLFEEEFSAYLPDYFHFDGVKKELDTINRKLYIRIINRLNRAFQKKNSQVGRSLTCYFLNLVMEDINYLQGFFSANSFL